MQTMCLVGARYEWGQIAWHSTNVLILCKTINNPNETYVFHVSFRANNCLAHAHNSGWCHA